MKSPYKRKMLTTWWPGTHSLRPPGDEGLPMLTSATCPYFTISHLENCTQADHRHCNFNPTLPFKSTFLKAFRESGASRTWATCLLAWLCKRTCSASNSGISVCLHSLSGTWTCATNSHESYFVSCCWKPARIIFLINLS